MSRSTSIRSLKLAWLGVLLGAALVAAACGEQGASGPTPESATAPEPGAALAVAQQLADGPGKIAFVSTRDGNQEIYVMNTDGSNQARLTNNTYPDVEPAWSHDGSKIAYVSRVGEGNWDIYVMDADGSNQTRLTFNLAREGSPAWSPDGARIAFTCTRQGHQEIFLMDADGSNQIPLTNLQPTGIFRRYSWPAWSPDGTKIAYRMPGEDTGGIYVMNTDGTNETRLTQIPGRAGMPSWSPDGSQIAFGSDRDGNFEIYLMNADGSNQTRLTDNPVRDMAAAWSPDGSKIAFVSDRDGNSELYVMDAYGSGTIRLITDTSNLELFSGPAWAPGSVPAALVAVSTPSSAVAAATPAATAGSLQLIGTALIENAESPLAGVWVHRNYAFVGSQSISYEPPYGKTGIRILDISDPANPTLVGRIPLRSVEKFSDDSGGEGPHSHGDAVATRINSAAFQGDIAIVLQGVPDTFTVDEYPMPFGIWDVTNPSEPQFLSSLSLGNHFFAGGILKKCVNGQAVYPLSEQHGIKAQERRYTAHEEGKH